MKIEEPMRNINPFGLRLQPALKARLEDAAYQNKRSLNAEISARLEASIAIDEYMAEIKAGTFADALALLESVVGDNDRMTASGEQTYGTAYSMLDQLLEEKLAPIRETLLQVKSYEKRGDKPSPTAKKPTRKRTRPLGMDQAEWDAQRAATENTKPND
ncbi:MAG: Arc family DNA-binding protein [Gammaproteobacteria bacterium]|nr:Arc family DNA-binding protein [Gammaproteobacteria bacterium]MBU0789891.1 Arc family DNA-binding protein [Gammaproteobacteria bacterium]MBU1805299.1 Arc family DNA-binding protein [Gammaproteobacteria bacterium]